MIQFNTTKEKLKLFHTLTYQDELENSPIELPSISKQESERIDSLIFKSLISPEQDYIYK